MFVKESVYLEKLFCCIVVYLEIIGRNLVIIKFVEVLIKVFRYYYWFLIFECNFESIIINFIVFKLVMLVVILGLFEFL